MSDQILECSFSLLSEGRVYTGNHRKYVVENAREICYSPATREMIKNREALGYYGHGRRILAGRMNLSEVDVIKLPDGTSAMVSNIPSNVTTKFDISADGTVSHSQQILDSETGRIVAGLNASRVGGFSWACPGKDGGRTSTTKLTGFAGFDYVLQPGFNANRAYVLEAAQGDMLLESLAAVLKNDALAEQYAAGLRLSDQIDLERQLAILENAAFENEQKMLDLEEQKKHIEADLTKVVMESAENAKLAKETKERFEGALKLIATSAPYVIPEDVQHAMMEGDFDRAKVLFESAKRLNYDQLPLPGTKFNSVNIDLPPKMYEEPEPGTAAYGLTLKL